MKIKPYPYQEEGINFIHTHNYCIIGDEMGLGKTLQALAAAFETKKKTLIVCPAFLQGVWQNEIDKTIPGDFDYRIVSYSKLKKCEEDFKWAEFVIADEIHYLKTPGAIRTQGFHYYIDRYRPEFLVGLSGTPIKNRVTEFFSLLLLMNKNPNHTNGGRLLDEYRTYTRFCQFFSNQQIKVFNGRQVIQYEGVKNVPILKQLLKGKYLRRKAKDVLDLPPITRIDVPSGAVIQAEDAELFEAWDQFHKTKTNMSTAKATSARMKADFTAQYVNNLVAQGESVVVFTDHISAAGKLAELIKGSLVITGGTPIDVRNTIVDKFNNLKVKVLIGTVGTTSMGYTLVAARHVIFNDLPWVPGDIAQAEKRIHRIGQDRPCFVHRIFRSSIDKYIITTLTAKMEEMGKII